MAKKPTPKNVPVVKPVKPVTRTRAKAATAGAPAPIAFHIAESFRPSAGERLAAHTAVFLERTGLLQGKAIPGDTAKKIIGARAIKWHTDKGNMVTTPQGLTLTVVGIEAFSARSINAEFKAAYEQVLIEGQCSEVAGVKNPAFIKAL